MNRTAKMILATAVATTVFGVNAYAGNPHGNHHRHDGNDGLALAAGIVNLVRTVIDPFGTAIVPTPGCVTVVTAPAPHYAPPPPPPAPPRHHAGHRAPEPPRKAAPPKAKEPRKAEPARGGKNAPHKQGRR